MISAIIPLYNKAATIERAILSVEANRHLGAEIEACVVDDGSTDGSPEIVERLTEDRPWIKFSRQKNAGAGAARNAAAALSSGDILAFLDADDYWLPGHTAALKDGFRRAEDVTLITTHFKRFIDGEPYQSEFFGVPEDGEVQHHFLSLAWGMTYTATSGTAVRKRVFDDVGGFDSRLRNGQDRALWAECALRGRIHRVQAVTAIWDNETSNSLMNEAMKNRHPKYENWIEEKILMLDGGVPDGCPTPGQLLQAHMVENLVRDSEIIGILAASKSVEWMRAEREAVLRRWGRNDLADRVAAAKTGCPVPPRLICRRSVQRAEPDLQAAF